MATTSKTKSTKQESPDQTQTLPEKIMPAKSAKKYLVKQEIKDGKIVNIYK